MFCLWDIGVIRQSETHFLRDFASSGSDMSYSLVHRGQQHVHNKTTVECFDEFKFNIRQNVDFRRIFDIRWSINVIFPIEFMNCLNASHVSEPDFVII